MNLLQLLPPEMQTQTGIIIPQVHLYHITPNCASLGFQNLTSWLNTVKDWSYIDGGAAQHPHQPNRPIGHANRRLRALRVGSVVKALSRSRAAGYASAVSAAS